MNKMSSVRNPRSGSEIMRDLSQFGLQAFFWDQDEFGPHTHEFVELVMVVRGHARHLFMARSYPVIPGDFFIVNTDESHAYTEINGLRIANILVTREFLSGHLPLLRTLRHFSSLFSLEPLFRNETSFRYKLHLRGENSAKMESLVQALVEESGSKREGYEVVCSALFLQLIATACRAFGSRTDQHVEHDLQGKQEAVAWAISFLESHYDKEMSAAEIAAAACLSPSRLRHIFKEATGTSLMDYLLHYRLDRAREIIRSERKPLSQIAYTVGFHDPAYFSRAYRKHFGHSPRRELTANE